jgi:hypothetical protein
VHDDGDLRPIEAVAERVVEQVVEDPADLLGVADGPDRIVGKVVLEAGAEEGDSRLDPFDRRECRLAKLDLALLEMDRARLCQWRGGSPSVPSSIIET